MYEYVGKIKSKINVNTIVSCPSVCPFVRPCLLTFWQTQIQIRNSDRRTPNRLGGRCSRFSPPSSPRSLCLPVAIPFRFLLQIFPKAIGTCPYEWCVNVTATDESSGCAVRKYVCIVCICVCVGITLYIVLLGECVWATVDTTSNEMKHIPWLLLDLFG